MKVLLACAPIEGLSGAQARAAAEKAWRTVRPDDEIRAWTVSDGRPVPGGGSGLEEALGGAPALWDRDGRPRAWRTERQVLLDYTAIFALTPLGGGAPEVSSAIAGEDLAWAADEGIGEVVVALPGPSAVTDLGFGILDALAPAGNGESLESRLARARARLGPLRITTLAADEQHLTGFHGLARMRMQRAGLSPARAQECDAEIAERVDELAHAASLGVAALLGSGPNLRGPYAGAGGGAAFMLEALGAHTYPVGEATVASRLGSDAAEAALAVYVASTIGADLPSGLLSLLRATRDETPVVLVYDHGGIAKSELVNLAIAGAYELRPELAFMLREPGAALANRLEMEGLLAKRTQAVARTWGY